MLSSLGSLQGIITNLSIDTSIYLNLNYNDMNYFHNSRKLSSFYRIKHSAILLRSQSVRKCSETIVMNLHIIGNTFANNQINSHTLHWFHICSRLFAIIAEINSVVNNLKIFGQVGPGLNPRKINLLLKCRLFV